MRGIERETGKRKRERERERERAKEGERCTSIFEQ
jgi:hypothetical protein